MLASSELLRAVRAVHVSPCSLLDVTELILTNRILLDEMLIVAFVAPNGDSDDQSVTLSLT